MRRAGSGIFQPTQNSPRQRPLLAKHVPGVGQGAAAGPSRSRATPSKCRHSSPAVHPPLVVRPNARRYSTFSIRAPIRVAGHDQKESLPTVRPARLADGQATSTLRRSKSGAPRRRPRKSPGRLGGIPARPGRGFRSCPRPKRAIAPRALSHSSCKYAFGVVRGDVGVDSLENLAIVIRGSEDRLGDHLAGNRRDLSRVRAVHIQPRIEPAGHPAFD